MTAVRAVLLASLAVLGLGCRARSPFDAEGAAEVRLARLQGLDVDPRTPLPAPIERWLGDGASGLPAELVPPGLLVGGPPRPQFPPGARTFAGFHELESRATKEPLAHELLAWAETAPGSGDGEGATCMYPEFGLDVSREDGRRAKVLVSLACGRVRVTVGDARPADSGLSVDARARFARLATRAFRSASS